MVGPFGFEDHLVAGFALHIDGIQGPFRGHKNAVSAPFCVKTRPSLSDSI